MLEVEGLDAAYGELRALSGVSVRVGPGEIVALVGSNGAGSSPARSRAASSRWWRSAARS